jgi:hypothetical protein
MVYPPNPVRWGVIDDARRRQHFHRRLAAFTAVAVIAVAAWGPSGLGGNSAPSGSAITRGLQARPPGVTLTASSLAACLARERNGVEGTPSRSLLAILGVLRRPATAADSLPRDLLDGSAPYLRYVRRARVANGVSYYVYPVVAVGCGQIGAHDAIALVSRPTGRNRHDVAIAAIREDITATEIEKAGAIGGSLPSVNNYPTITMIVPDRVASVTLRYPNHETRTARPVGNVLVIASPQRRISPFSGLMIWRAADGHIIKTLHL